jgi:hypothetical protein
MLHPNPLVCNHLTSHQPLKENALRRQVLSGNFGPTPLRVEIISGLVAAGLKQIQVSSFVHPHQGCGGMRQQAGGFSRQEVCRKNGPVGPLMRN